MISKTTRDAFLGLVSEKGVPFVYNDSDPADPIVLCIVKHRHIQPDIQRCLTKWLAAGNEERLEGEQVIDDVNRLPDKFKVPLHAEIAIKSIRAGEGTSGKIELGEDNIIDLSTIEDTKELQGIFTDYFTVGEDFGSPLIEDEILALFHIGRKGGALDNYSNVEIIEAAKKKRALVVKSPEPFQDTSLPGKGMDRLLSALRTYQKEIEPKLKKEGAVGADGAVKTTKRKSPGGSKKKLPAKRSRRKRGNSS